MKRIDDLYDEAFQYLEREFPIREELLDTATRVAFANNYVLSAVQILPREPGPAPSSPSFEVIKKDEMRYRLQSLAELLERQTSSGRSYRGLGGSHVMSAVNQTKAELESYLSGLPLSSDQAQAIIVEFSELVEPFYGPREDWPRDREYLARIAEFISHLED